MFLCVLAAPTQAGTGSLQEALKNLSFLVQYHVEGQVTIVTPVKSEPPPCALERRCSLNNSKT